LANFRGTDFWAFRYITVLCGIGLLYRPVMKPLPRLRSSPQTNP